ncbi:MAG: ferrous iron transport protein A [Petrotogaceae bacterium]|jgi:ferrous iron transport protein A|nr:ferrous iron transport protein A [Petrotogaceae bacterium]
MILSECKPGFSGYVKSILGEGNVKKRLLVMGVTPGSMITVVKKAPFGDPIEITIKNYSLTIRKEEAAYITVEKGDEKK